MKKVLYISNISVPYRSEFFKQLGTQCDLTVLYERKKSSNRDDEWSKIQKDGYMTEYLDGKSIGNENSFSFKILKYLKKKFDCIFVGCYNSPVEILAIIYMRLLKIKYVLNIDGEIFQPKSRIKKWIRNFVIKGASCYCCAGETNIKSICDITKSKKIYPYYFSSLTNDEIQSNKQTVYNRQDYILVVGQYENYKGLDLIAEIAKRNPQLKFCVVGTGKKSYEFMQLANQHNSDNIENVPFLKKTDLYTKYMNCKMLVLPSRQECWGLVINEAAAFGTPIVSTYGSGAGIEFLSDKYSQYLAQSNDVDDLEDKIISLYNESQCLREEYGNYLKNKSLEYSIEKMVEVHWDIIH